MKTIHPYLRVIGVLGVLPGTVACGVLRDTIGYWGYWGVLWGITING